MGEPCCRVGEPCCRAQAGMVEWASRIVPDGQSQSLLRPWTERRGYDPPAVAQPNSTPRQRGEGFWGRWKNTAAVPLPVAARGR